MVASGLLSGGLLIGGCSAREPGEASVFTATQKRPLYTTEKGAAYIAECQGAGVPVPTTVLDNTWENHGEILDTFISKNTMVNNTFVTLESELWSWSSSSPRGICLALPRWMENGPQAGRAKLFGIICLGTDTSKACFFDNPDGTHFLRTSTPPISEFLGGIDLVDNGGGVCTDCHAGANPFIIHPEKKAFEELRGSSTRFRLLEPASGWYEPIAPAGNLVPWPQNPGPDTRLYGIRSADSCNRCHLLPQVSDALPEYCSKVLETAVERPDETMPQGPVLSGTYEDYRLRFKNHYLALLDFCNEAPPTSGGVVVDPVDYDDDPTVVSPPTIVDPLYACAESVAVQGVLNHAKVDLYLNGVAVASADAEPGDVVSLVLPGPLQDGDRLFARQTRNAVESAPSPEVEVDEYPDATLPKPVINPIVYRCADSISVSTVPGAKIQAWKNGGNPPEIQRTSTGRQKMSPGATPWQLGDEFVVQASLCAKTSTFSDPVYAVEPPATLRAPKLDPEQPYEGQEYVVATELDNGAYAKISRVSPALYLGDTCSAPSGVSCNFDIKTSALNRPLNAGEALSAEPSLFCPTGGPTGTPISTPPAIDCKYLPAPEINVPRIGQDYFTVTRSLPGAAIRAYDALGDEIADGQGTVIRLNPPRVFVLGDLITVIQQVGNCLGERGFQIQAR